MIRALVSLVTAVLVVAGILSGNAWTDTTPPAESTPAAVVGAGADSASIGSPPRLPASHPCRLPRVLPVLEDIRDPVFAVLLGVIEENHCGVITRRRLDHEVRRSGRKTRLPIRYLSEIRRTFPEGSRRAEVSLLSTQQLDVPIPYRVLIYHPGRIRASKEVEFEEWTLGRVRLEGRGRFEDTDLEDVRLWGLRRGRVQLDVDGWLDRMLGSRLDDTEILGFALFRYEGQLLGMALGYNEDGKGRSGAFSFEKDSILFPSPAPLKAAGRYLRSRLERLMPEAAAVRRG